MKSSFVVAFAALALACNSAPQNTCTPPGNSLISSTVPAQNCNGVCVSLTDADTNQVCVVDCTDAGNAVCDAGFACFPALGTRSFCLPPCTSDGGCELSVLTCAVDAGFCY